MHDVMIKPNSKPILLKRFIADGFDIVCLFMLFMLLNYVVSNSYLATTYRKHMENCSLVEKYTVANYEKEDVARILYENKDYQEELFATNLHGFLLKALAALISEIILFVIIPLSNKDKVSLGKLMCGVLLFDESRQSKANNAQIVYRFILIYLLESVSLYFWTGIYTFLLVPVLRFIILIINSRNKTLIDYLTSVMLIEKLSYCSINQEDKNEKDY